MSALDERRSLTGRHHAVTRWARSRRRAHHDMIETAKKQRRTKSFSGCWTCRSRRVKCDEQSPSCQRCLQFGVRCEGYDIRLHWIQCKPDELDDRLDDDRARSSGSGGTRRSYARLDVSTLPRMSSPELDATLRQIDEWDPNQSRGLEEGAFSVFSTEIPERQACDTRHLLSKTIQASATIPSGATRRPDNHLSLPTIETPTVVGNSPAGLGLQYFEDELEDSGPLPLTSNTPGAAHGSAYTDTVPVAHTLLSLRKDAGQPTPGITRETGQQPTSSRQDHDGPPRRHLDALSMPSKQKRLIHHWVTFTSRKLVLLDEPHNPCRTMMLPMALQGLVSKSEDSNADVAIFHAVCASAAYNLYELGGRKDEDDHVLALSHDQQAIHHLRHNLTRAHEHRDQSFAMAIMACIAVEAVSGTTQRWRMHVSGGLAYLANLQSQGLPEATLSAFRQHMVKMAMLCGFPVPEEMKSFLGDNDHSAERLEFTFPYYGVSRSFLRALDRINVLAASPSTVAVDTPMPATETELDAFELQLYLDFPSLPVSTLHQEHSPSHRLVISHTARAFYYATLAYFQRRIRHAPLADVQDLVRLGVGELEALERAAGEDELGCIMLWPALVLGAECGGPAEQGRMRAWFRSQRRLGFRNVVVLEELVETVWLSRERGAGGAQWWAVVEEARFDIFRL